MREKEFSGWKKRYNIIIVCVLGIIGVAGYGCFHIDENGFRLDQYSTTILGTTAGIVGTMFGLTAASYAFIWGDLRSDRQENRHLSKVLERYSRKLWYLFACALGVTVLVIFTSLIGMALVQFITNPSLFNVKGQNGEIIAGYYNKKFIYISVITLINITFSVIAVIAMAWMNWDIFYRDFQYAAIAESVMRRIQKKYDMTLQDKKGWNSDSIEYKKIHNLEILVERVLKNHESVGEAFAESQRRGKLLAAVIENELSLSYDIKKYQKEGHLESKAVWEYLDNEKRMCRYYQCRTNAIREYNMLDEKHVQVAGKLKPCKCSFISVYNDLLLYRDNSLVWEEKCKKNQKLLNGGKVERHMAQGMFGQRALRYTIKKRLLIFYLRGENFSDMDLTEVSFSGADLRYSNLSGCNLTRIRLKGTNCEGTDFTRSKMTGMYFSDVHTEGADEVGEIQLTCRDIRLNEESEDREGICCRAWNPYTTKEATRFTEATFKEADVSRAYLKAPGELEGKQEFPYDTLGVNQWKLGKEKVIFSLKGTNFDCAKIFFSYLKNIDLTNSSLTKAQMYNTGMVQIKAKSTNLSESILTHACLAWCDFENADFSSALLAETVLVRVSFKSAKIKNANFSYSNIVACNFEDASCQNASFKNIIQDFKRLKSKQPNALNGIDLGEERELRFCHATLTNTDFSGAQLDHILFNHAVGQGCIFTQIKGKHVVFDNAIFNSSVFNTARFEKGTFRYTVLRNSIFSSTRFIDCIFIKSDFSEALFTLSDKQYFIGGYMYRVDFSNIKGLTAACFADICLREINFRGLGIQKTDFLNSVSLIDCIF